MTEQSPPSERPTKEMTASLAVILSLTPFIGNLCSYLAFMGMTPFDPTPTGMWSNIAWASCSFTGWTSLSSKLVLSKRTPQLMSNPTPPTK